MKTNKNNQQKKDIEKVVFFGTPEFAVPTLDLLAQSKYKPVLVVTQPDRKQGRNMRLTPSPVKLKAIEHEIETIQPEDINEEYVIDRIGYVNPDIIVTAAYGGFLKADLLEIPQLGCVNLHPSLLPKYRGAAPINYALFNGEKKTGNTIFRMVKRMDSGPILYQSEMVIEHSDNATTLSEKLALQGAKDVLNLLQMFEAGTVTETEQNEDEATYSRKIEKGDALINWADTSLSIFRKVRGLAEDPGAYTFFRKQRLKILQIEILKRSSGKHPGVVLAAGDLSSYDSSLKERGIVVATGNNDIFVNRVQLAGKMVMSAFDFQLGAKIVRGERFSNDF